MKRPRSVTIIGVLVLLQGVLFVLFASLTLGQAGNALLGLPAGKIALGLPQISLRAILPAVAALILSSFALLSGVGILRLRPWAWLMAMIIQGINLAAELVSYTRGYPDYLNMAFSVIIVLYLNQRDIQRSFSAALHIADPLSPHVVEATQADEEAVQREIR